MVHCGRPKDALHNARGVNHYPVAPSESMSFAVSAASRSRADRVSPGRDSPRSGAGSPRSSPRPRGDSRSSAIRPSIHATPDEPNAPQHPAPHEKYLSSPTPARGSRARLAPLGPSSQVAPLMPGYGPPVPVSGPGPIPIPVSSGPMPGPYSQGGVQSDAFGLPAAPPGSFRRGMGAPPMMPGVFNVNEDKLPPALQVQLRQMQIKFVAAYDVSVLPCGELLTVVHTAQHSIVAVRSRVAVHPRSGGCSIGVVPLVFRLRQ